MDLVSETFYDFRIISLGFVTPNFFDNFTACRIFLITIARIIMVTIIVMILMILIES